MEKITNKDIKEFIEFLRKHDAVVPFFVECQFHLNHYGKRRYLPKNVMDYLKTFKKHQKKLLVAGSFYFFDSTTFSAFAWMELSELWKVKCWKNA